MTLFGSNRSSQRKKWTVAAVAGLVAFTGIAAASASVPESSQTAASRQDNRRDDRTNASALRDVEDIKKLKARYFRHVDAKEYDELWQLFTEDATIYFPDDGYEKPENVDFARVQFAEFLDPIVSVHIGTLPEITIHSSRTASGIWQMQDRLYTPLDDGSYSLLNGYGRYHEEYRKVDGQWKISALELRRAHFEFHESVAVPGMS